MIGKLSYPLLTESALKATINNDPATCFYFSRVLAILPLPAALMDKQKSLQLLILGEKITFFISLPLSLGSFWFLPWYFCLALVVTAISALAALDSLKRSLTASIAWTWVSQTFKAEELASWTLFQLGEQISRRNGIASLVDVTAAWDWKMRRIMLGIYVTAVFILFLNFIATFVWVVCGVLLTSTGFRYLSLPRQTPTTAAR